MQTKNIAIRIGVAFTLMVLFVGSAIAAEEPVCDLADPVNVCMLVSPDTIMLAANTPVFAIEVEDNIGGVLPGFPVAYDVQDMNFKHDVRIELGVIVTAEDGIYKVGDDPEVDDPIVGEIAIGAEDRKTHDVYEISPTTGRLVVQYTRSSVFGYKLGVNSEGADVTVGALLESACGGGDMTGSVPFYIRGTFEDGMYSAGTEFYGVGDGDVMLNSVKKGGKNK